MNPAIASRRFLVGAFFDWIVAILLFVIALNALRAGQASVVS